MTPEVGEASRCKTCGREIRFEGRFWMHVESELRHLPRPEGFEDEHDKVLDL